MLSNFKSKTFVIFSARIFDNKHNFKEFNLKGSANINFSLENVHEAPNLSLNMPLEVDIMGFLLKVGISS